MIENTNYKKQMSVFINTDIKSYNVHRMLKIRLVNQQQKIIDLEERLKVLEELILDKN